MEKVWGKFGIANFWQDFGSIRLAQAQLRYKVQEYMIWQHRFKLSMTSKVGYGGRRSSAMAVIEQRNFY
jgi:hypothetical protein